VQSDAFNRSRLRTVIAVVLMTNVRLVEAPGNVLLPAKATGLPKDSVANVSQVITVDRDFLLERAGRVRGQSLKDVDKGLRLVLTLEVLKLAQRSRSAARRAGTFSRFYPGLARAARRLQRVSLPFRCRPLISKDRIRPVPARAHGRTARRSPDVLVPPSSRL